MERLIPSGAVGWTDRGGVRPALAAIRTHNSAFGARYRRIMRHRGHKKAAIAVAHSPPVLTVRPRRSVHSPARPNG